MFPEFDELVCQVTLDSTGRVWFWVTEESSSESLRTSAAMDTYRMLPALQPHSSRISSNSNRFPSGSVTVTMRRSL